MYKIVIWVNRESPVEKWLINNKDIFIIGEDNRYLSWNELQLTSDQLERVDSNTQFIFDSHGENEKYKTECYYYLKSPQNKIKEYSSNQIITSIFNNLKDAGLEYGASLHIMSCFAGKGHDKILKEVNKHNVLGEWAYNTIFLHSGETTIRGARINKSITLINDLIKDETHSNPLNTRFDILKNLFSSIYGDSFLIQSFSNSSESPLSIINKFSGDNLIELQSNLKNQWQSIANKLNKFAQNNKLPITIDSNIDINIESILQNVFEGDEAHSFYKLNLSHQLFSKEKSLTKVETFIDNLFKLVEDKQITIETYNKIIAASLTRYNNSFLEKSLNLPPSEVYKILLSKDKIDLINTKHIDQSLLIWLLKFNFNFIKAIITHPNVTCKNLDSLPNFNWSKLMEYKEANKLLPLLLELSEPIDLNQEIDFGNDAILTIVMKYSTLEILELFLKHKVASIDLNKEINQLDTVLTKIFKGGPVKNLEVILKHALPVDLNAEINEWYTALTAIIENISLENLELLLKEKSAPIDLSKKINQFNTVLTKIIEDGLVKNLEVILKHALPIDLKNDKKLLELLVSEKGQYATYIPLLLKHSDPLTQEELENHGLAEFMAHEESLLDIDNILIDEFTTIDSSHEIEFTGNIENI